MATDKERLEYEVTLQNKGFTKGIAGVNASAKSSANILTQSFGRGLTDIQFGFKAVQNNIESMSIAFKNLTAQSGGVAKAFKLIGTTLMGPAGIFLAFQTLLAIGPHVIKWFKSIVGASDEATNALAKFNEEQREAAKTAGEKENELLRAAKLEIEEKIEGINKLEKARKRGQKTLSDEQIALRNTLQLQANIYQTKIDLNIANDKDVELAKQKTAELKKQQEEYKKELAYWKDRESITPFSVDFGIKDEDFGSDDIYSLLGINPNNPIIVPVNDILVLDEEDYDLFGDFADKAVQEAEDVGNELGQALQSSLTGAFTGIGQAIGDALSGNENFGDAFLKLLGQFMQQFGAALIGIGVAEIALKSGNPFLMIAGGVALIAAGSALSNAYSSKPSLSSSGGVGRSNQTGTTTTPSSIQGIGQGGQLVATVRGQDLRFALQAANDSYTALS